ncbi:MAG: glutamine--tRNA ligase/YqeY domain fusion protein [Saprospiraceae bacterium]|jgi:glutaminyl-tRNA synthetase|nr:glutamine--tRNA ligase/YqeY domain fusion protein [Saprospiraceae bacterium]
MTEEKRDSLNFIEQIIEDDLSAGKHAGRILTRFPPEPNGYLHIGHAKAICINFEIAKKYGGSTNLRFDDTNPTTEETEYVESIQKDIRWLGFEWNDKPLYASDYFGKLYSFAVTLIKKGLAYVDDSTPEEIATMKGTPGEPGVDSPYKKRSIEENIDLFERMKNGEFADGSRVLRANVDMTSPNMLMRDPIIYRIKKEHHHRTGDIWCIYPLYDFAHGQSDSVEGITHSLCSLEFIHHRPLYDWFIEKLEIFPSRQIEFARMNVEYMITSKRKLLRLVSENKVTGWDDPRMPTISGMRRRGYPPAAIRTFCDKVGVAKRENTIEINLLEACVREELNKTAERVMVVIDPVKVIITNYPDGKTEKLISENNPEDPDAGSRELTFSRELYIEREDFIEDAPPKYFRMTPGADVRLKNAYILHCTGCEKDENGKIKTIFVTYYPDSKSGEDISGIKPKGTLHWVSAADSVSCDIRLYDRLFTMPDPTEDEEVDFLEYYNRKSLSVVNNAKMEASLKNTTVGRQYQFMRQGYFCTDIESTPDHFVFNRTVGLKESYTKEVKKH